MSNRSLSYLRGVAVAGLVLLMAAASSGALEHVGRFAVLGVHRAGGVWQQAMAAVDVRVAAAQDGANSDNSGSDNSDNSGSDNSDNSGSDNSDNSGSDNSDNSGSDNSDKGIRQPERSGWRLLRWLRRLDSLLRPVRPAARRRVPTSRSPSLVTMSSSRCSPGCRPA